jgi:biopolymer transport protein ExbD
LKRFLILTKYILTTDMSNRFLIVLIFIGFVSACNSGKKETSRFNIILFGYDSIACYYGNSTELTDLRYGKITDSLFMDTVLTNAIDRRPGLIVLKPGDGAAVLGNWEHLDTLFKINNFENRKIDTLDEKEQKFFNTTSIIPWLKEHQQPLKLFLPREKSDVVVPSDKTLIVLIINEHEAYAYNGTNMKNGSKCGYEELGSYLATKKSRSDFLVVIKPGEKSTYKSTVDILDLMTVHEVKNYKMEEPTKEEQTLINELLVVD